MKPHRPPRGEVSRRLAGLQTSPKRKVDLAAGINRAAGQRCRRDIVCGWRYIKGLGR